MKIAIKPESHRPFIPHSDNQTDNTSVVEQARNSSESSNNMRQADFNPTMDLTKINNVTFTPDERFSTIINLNNEIRTLSITTEGKKKNFYCPSLSDLPIEERREIANTEFKVSFDFKKIAGEWVFDAAKQGEPNGSSSSANLKSISDFTKNCEGIVTQTAKIRLNKPQEIIITDGNSDYNFSIPSRKQLSWGDRCKVVDAGKFMTFRFIKQHGAWTPLKAKSPAKDLKSDASQLETLAEKIKLIPEAAAQGENVASHFGACTERVIKISPESYAECVKQDKKPQPSTAESSSGAYTPSTTQASSYTNPHDNSNSNSTQLRSSYSVYDRSPASSSTSACGIHNGTGYTSYSTVGQSVAAYRDAYRQSAGWSPMRPY